MTTARISYDDFDALAAKHGIEIRDVEQSLGHFDKWCDAKGYGQTDSEGHDRNTSRLWFSEYEDAPDGEAVCPPYRDLWHWLLKQSDFIDTCETTDLYHRKDFTISQSYPIPAWFKPAFDLLFDAYGDEVIIAMEVSR